MILIAALTAAAAVFLGVYTLASPGRPRSITNRLGQFDRTTSHDREAMLAAPFVARVGTPLATKFQSGFSRLLPTTIVSGIETRLVQAGEPASLAAFLTAQIVAICL